jgi:hypothetical protein
MVSSHRKRPNLTIPGKIAFRRGLECGWRSVMTGALMLAASLPPARTAENTPPVATRFLQLFQDLRDAQTRAPRRKVSFRLSAGEINEYMRYALQVTPRPGLDSVSIKIFPNNYVSTFSMVDFDAVEKWKPGTIPALLRPLLHGKKSIWVDYRFQTANSHITFSVEKAYYNDLRLPAFFVGKMIEIVAARQPEKYDTSKPMPLPFGLSKAWTAEAVVMGEN